MGYQTGDPEADAALGQAEQRAADRDRHRRPIDYARMGKLFPQQKAALTRALGKPEGDKRVAAVVLACRRAKTEWESCGAWPDDWSRWQRALDDSLPWGENVRLEDL